jgi:hypothetical protein
MSNVVSPRGPLPPRIYWRRRLLLLVVLVGAVVLVGRLFGGGDDTETVADRARSKPTPATTKTTAQEPARQAAAPGATATTKRAARPPRAARGAGVQPGTPALSGPTGPLAQPAGKCDAADVAVAPDVQDTDAFGPVPLRIGLSATTGRACTFAFGQDTVALRVTSGDDLIWESLHCPSALPERSVVVRPGWLSYVTVDWSGRRASQGCGGGDFAQPGYYWAEAAALGGEPGRSQFELQTPPKPEPKPKPERGPESKPSARASAEPSAEPTAEPTAERSPATNTGPSESPAAPDSGTRAGGGTRSRDDR